MKRTFVVTWALALFVVSLPLAIHAATPVAPHSGNTIACLTCHAATDQGAGNINQAVTSPAIYNNVCQSCHRPGDAAAAAKPLAATDASLVFGGQGTTVGSVKTQTSHRWDGSDTNPAAGALPPIQEAMTSNHQDTNWVTGLSFRARTGNQLACVRCHSVHIVPNNNGSLLRMANDQDQMCMDCHRSRNQQTHLTGTHPVNINYNSATGSFNKPIQNANPVNTTSDLQTKLSPTGNIVCSTCHGVHFTDSRSSTFDGASSVKGRYNYANLSTGDGYLLRTDRRGATVATGQADKLNICTNCHSNKKSHNAKGQDVQCTDCHGAHVDYDPTDPTSAPNVFLIKRNQSKAGVASKVYFRYTGSQREYKNAQGTGVCQGCHAVPTGTGSPAAHTTSTTAADCNACHFHNNQIGSFSSDCTSCHGNPPTTSNIGGTTGLATPATGATGGAVGAHQMHAVTLQMACNTCHNGYAKLQMGNKTIDLGFDINGTNVPGFKGSISSGTYNNTTQLNSPYSDAGSSGFTGPVVANIAINNRSCSTVYCHGGTLTQGAPGDITAAIWVGGSTEVYCGSCHGTTVDTITFGSHKVHAGSSMAMDCNNCHGATNQTTHVQGSVQWNLSLIGANAQYKPAGTGTVSATVGETNKLAPSAAYGTCSNIICHGQATAIPWGGTLYSSTDTCAKCHSSLASVTADGSFYSTAYPTKQIANTDSKVGAHAVHLKWLGINSATGCSECHSSVTSVKDTNHMNGVTNFTTTWSALAKQGGLSPSYNATTGQCSSVYCHGTGTPKWNEPFLGTIAACGKCHGLPPVSHSGINTPASFAEVATICSGCHPDVLSATPGTTYDTVFNNKSLHVNGSTIATGGCTGCHGYPPAKTGFVPKQNQWSSARVEDYAGAGGAHTVAGHIDPKANPNDAWNNCQSCHNKADHVTSPKVFTPSSNIKVRPDSRVRFANSVLGKYSSNKKDGALHVTGTCSSVACHFQKSPKW